MISVSKIESIKMSPLKVVGWIHVDKRTLIRLRAENLSEKYNPVLIGDANPIPPLSNLLYSPGQFSSVESRTDLVFAVLRVAANRTAIQHARMTTTINEECCETDFKL